MLFRSVRGRVLAFFWSRYTVPNHLNRVCNRAVTSQPGQAFAPLTEHLKSILNISKEKLFENTANRIFYEDKASAHPADPKWYTFSVPGKSGTCSGKLTFLPSLPDDLARQIVFSLGPALEPHKGTF